MRPRLKEKYIKEIIPRMLKEYKFKNVMEVPGIEKICINMGVGSATQNIKELETASQELAIISGQKPVITIGRKEQINFPEVNYESILSVKGMNVTITTTAKSNEEAQFLLEEFGFPFK